MTADNENSLYSAVCIKSSVLLTSVCAIFDTRGDWPHTGYALLLDRRETEKGKRN